MFDPTLYPVGNMNMWNFMAIHNIDISYSLGTKNVHPMVALEEKSMDH